MFYIAELAVVAAVLMFAMVLLIQLKPFMICHIGRYDIEKGKGGKFNSGFWGQECGPVVDNTKGRVHKYMEDALSVNTSTSVSLQLQLQLQRYAATLSIR